MPEKPHTMTVGELRNWLADYADDTELYFGMGELSFGRVKSRRHERPQLVQIEFNEIYVVIPWND